MERIVFLFMAVCTLTAVNGQNSIDALRYSTESTSGTARFNALSGAFGALGGDFSAMAINPAGSAVFSASSASVTFSLYDRENTASYFNKSNKSIDTDVALNQAGGVFVFKNPKENSKLKKFSIGLNYDSTRNFDDEVFIVGSGNTSISEFFLNQAQGITLDNLQQLPGESIGDLYSYLGENFGVSAQNALLGYQGFIIDPVTNDPSNTQYVSNVAPGNFLQEYTHLTSGYSGKFTINFAAQITNNFFFGINLNSHVIDFEESTFLFETNNNPGSLVDRIAFENNLAVDGNGFSAQLGGIAKIADNLRVGLSLESPTWYYISEETTQFLETRRTENQVSIFESIDPRIINVYEDYQLRTPAKAMASAAYIFGKKGLISFDYSYKDYSNMKFSSDFDENFFNGQNSLIDSSFKSASTFKLGGEYRINELSLRGGVRYEESPYVDEVTVGDLSGFSLGLGYNLGKYSIDLSYARAEQDRNQQLYSTGLTDSAAINTVYSNFSVGVGFHF